MEAITLLAQLIGGIGIALIIATFQVNKRGSILKVTIASCLIWALYYVLMGAYTGAGMVLIGAIRTYVFERYRKHEWIYELFILIAAAITFVTWSGPKSLLPFFGIILATTAMWQKLPQNIRSWSLFQIFGWFPYNFLSHSYVGMAGDLVTFASVVIGIIRFDLLPKYRKRQQTFEFDEAKSL